MAANENGMITEDSIFDPVKDARPAMDAEDLDAALSEMMREDRATWLIEGVVEACTTGDLLFLQRQVERHVPGWVTP